MKKCQITGPAGAGSRPAALRVGLQRVFVLSGRMGVNVKIIFKYVHKLVGIVVILLLLTALAGCGPDINGSGNMAADASKMLRNGLQVHFIDVGQADAILIKGPDNQNIMIDAGNNADSENVVNYIKKQGVKSFKAVIGTHPHEDHIGGLDAVINNFDVEKVYLPKVTNNTETFRDVLKAVKDKGITVSTAKKGVKLELSGMEMEFLGPVGTSYKELNDYSAVAKLTYGSTGFLFEGDAEAVSENEMLQSDIAGKLEANLIKIGHHGSSSSTTPAFLNKVKPEYAVISVGRNNDYKHPHKETMELLKKLSVPVYRTDECGTIIAESDGKSITFNVKAGSYSYGGSSAGSGSSSEDKPYVDTSGRGLIKGNINSKGEKIYHLPGGANYERTIPEAWFRTEEEAQAAGYRKSQR